jgi:hypothetical protein
MKGHNWMLPHIKVLSRYPKAYRAIGGEPVATYGKDFKKYMKKLKRPVTSLPRFPHSIGK